MPANQGSFVIGGKDVEECLRAVRRIARAMLPRLPPNVLWDDVVAAGICALLEAWRKGAFGRELVTEGYLYVRIRGAIWDEVRRHDWLTRRARAKGGAVLGLDDLPELEAADDETPSPYDAVVAYRAVRALRTALAALPRRQKEVLAIRYGEGLDFVQIAASLGVTAARVSQLHARALQNLRERGGLPTPGDDGDGRGNGRTSKMA